MALLSAVKTEVEGLAERSIVQGTFLLACESVVRDIESRDYRVPEETKLSEACDGTSVYTVTGMIRRKVVRVKYVNIFGESFDLIRKDGLEPPLSTAVGLKTLYYDFLGSAILQLNSNPLDGEIRVDQRGLVLPFTTATDVPYEPLAAGVLAYLGGKLWQDVRTQDWKLDYETQIKAMLLGTLPGQINVGAD